MGWDQWLEAAESHPQVQREPQDTAQSPQWAQQIWVKVAAAPGGAFSAGSYK